MLHSLAHEVSPVCQNFVAVGCSARIEPGTLLAVGGNLGNELAVRDVAVARVVEVPGAISQGRTREEARENVIDALGLLLSSDPFA